MSRIYADRVMETSSTAGTGPVTLAAAVTGFRRFNAVCAIGDTVDYAIFGADTSGAPTGEWETGHGTYTAADTLTRTTVQASSNADALVNFAAGTKQVLLTENAASIEVLASGGPAAAQFKGPFGEAPAILKTDTFDSGVVPANYTIYGTKPFTILDEADATIGTTKVFGGRAIGDSSSSRFTFLVRCTAALASLDFRYWQQGESNYDGVYVRVDGTVVFTDKTIEPGFLDKSIAISPGDHTVEMGYSSDNSGSSGFDGVLFSRIAYPAPDPDAAYTFGDIVSYQDYYWECLTAGTAQAPGVGAAWGRLGRVDNAVPSGGGGGGSSGTAPTIVQKAYARGASGVTATATLPAAPTVGNFLVYVFTGRLPSTPAGFTLAKESGYSTSDTLIYYRKVKAGDPAAYSQNNADITNIAIYEVTPPKGIAVAGAGLADTWGDTLFPVNAQPSLCIMVVGTDSDETYTYTGSPPLLDEHYFGGDGTNHGGKVIAVAYTDYAYIGGTFSNNNRPCWSALMMTG